MANNNERLLGTVKWFDSQKGYGFIIPSNGGQDLFLHRSGIRSRRADGRGGGFRTLVHGETVEFLIRPHKKNRTKAVDVTGPNQGPLQGRPSRGGGDRGGRRSRGCYGQGGRGRGGGGYRGGYGEGSSGGCIHCGDVDCMALDWFQRCYGGRGGGGGGFRGGYVSGRMARDLFERSSGYGGGRYGGRGNCFNNGGRSKRSNRREMAASSSSTKPTPPGEIRNWLDLPRDVTASILSRLGAIEIMTSAQMVCKMWLDICKDPLMWRTIDMRNLGDPGYGLDFIKMCSNVIDRSCGQLVDLNIEYFGTDGLLLHAVTSSKLIKRLRFACCYDVSDEGLIEAIENLPLLEELDLTLCSLSETFIEALGRCCPQFKTLKLNHQAYKYPDMDSDEENEFNAYEIEIGKNLPGLRHLQLIGSSMTNMGLQAILDGCRNLESLDLRRCLNIDLKGNLGKRCGEQIKLVKLPHDSLKGYGFIADPYMADPNVFFGREDFDFPGGANSAWLFRDYFGYGYSSEELDYDDFTRINYYEELELDDIFNDDDDGFFF
ncbi:F-box protein SKIP19 [Cannabis sativa]|nr:F-box protein SKIP19 [Cannabis sativa]